MSLYRDPRSPFYWYDFQHQGRRFFGSTKRTSKREAEAVERQERDRAKREMAAAGVMMPLTMDYACGRYWSEVGQHHASADDTWRNLEWLIDCLGKDTLLANITDAEVASMVQRRRGQSSRNGGKLIANATVNRSATEVLRKVFTRARKKWGARFEHEPDWKEHMLPEPGERVRELHDHERDLLDAATRDDLAPFFAFASASGVRLNECLLKWPEVNWGAGQIVKLGKGGKRVTVPITPTIRGILRPLMGHDPVHVFTYVAKRTDPRKGVVKGRRYPLTYEGAKTAWRRLRARSGVSDFRFHDFRHDFATKLLRDCRNLKLVQRALNHAELKTTGRYAHVLDVEVGEAMEQAQKRARESRNQSRNDRRKIANALE
jgi:integrase